MVSLLRSFPSPASPLVEGKYFCVFCDVLFGSPKDWRKHLVQHFVFTDSGFRPLSPAITHWIKVFFKSQYEPFQQPLPARAQSFADCILCRNFLDPLVGHKVVRHSTRFHKQGHRLEDHLRSHLKYSAFSCSICSQPFSHSQYSSTVVQLTSSKRGRFFAIVRAAKPLSTRVHSRSAVERHIRRVHLRPTTRTANKITAQPKAFVGFAPIDLLEKLVRSIVQRHRRNLTTIRAVKNRVSDCDKVRRMPDSCVKKIKKIGMQPCKSYFTISSEQEQMLDDIDDIISRETADLQSSSEFPICRRLRQPADCVSCVPAERLCDQEAAPQPCLTWPATPPSQGSSRATPLKKRRSSSAHVVSGEKTSGSRGQRSSKSAYNLRSGSGSSTRLTRGQSIPLLSQRSLRSNRVVRRLDFDSIPDATDQLRCMTISSEELQSINFLNSVDPDAEGVEIVSHPSDAYAGFFPYDQEVQKRVERIILSIVDEAPELSHLRGESVENILMAL